MTATERVDVDARPRPRGDRPRLLLTNDDGVAAPGLRALVEALDGPFDLLVVAPDGDRSGSGTGIGQFEPTRGVDVVPVEVAGVQAYALGGPPGLAVMSAMLGAFGDLPDLVVSGVNAGANLGHSVIHSGTVGAVLTARTFGVSGLAVSVAESDPWQFGGAARTARRCAEWMLERPGRLTLNLNVPADEDACRGLRWADLDEFGHFRVAIADVPGRTMQFEVGAPTEGLDPGSDTALLRQGWATVTPISTVEAVSFPADAPPGVT